MTKANTRILGSAIALSLVMGAAATAHAGMSPQGMSPQGMSPQGMSPQGMSPQGMSPQGISLEGVSLTNLTFANGVTLSSSTLSGSQLQGYLNGALQSGTAFIGSTLQGTLVYVKDGVTATEDITLYIADVKQDTVKNTMVCDPMNPSATSCIRNYNSNSDIYLYKLYYWVGSLADAPVIAPICAGDQMAMMFAGTWDDEGAWVEDPLHKKLTVACTQGVLTKCAKQWGYKPWRAMVDKHGNAEAMRSYHQACTRAARADYSGLGFSFTMNGTMIDMFDNGGYNVPATTQDLTNGGFQPTALFESIFSSVKSAGSTKPDFWGKWMSAMRWGDLPALAATYGYPDISINWGSDAPKADLPNTWSASFWVSNMETRYAQNHTEVAVFNPVWSPLGTIATGTTVGSFNHTTSLTCNPSGHAPDRAYRWTAPTTGTYQIDTNGSLYDTVLYVYDGGVELPPCDDDSGVGTQSLLQIPLTAGQEIAIVVDGFNAAAGNYVLNVNKLY